MSKNGKLINDLCLLATYGDVRAVTSIARRMNDLDILSDAGNPLLMEVMQAMESECENRYKIVNLFLDLGVNPNRLSTTQKNILQIPVWQMDTKMISLLLRRGCDPNYGCGSSRKETLYDWALHDYLFVICLDKYPMFFDGFHDEDKKLAHIARLALSLERPRPEHLQLLRKSGAITYGELVVAAGGSHNKVITWNAGWRATLFH